MWRARHTRKCPYDDVASEALDTPEQPFFNIVFSHETHGDRSKKLTRDDNHGPSGVDLAIVGQSIVHDIRRDRQRPKDYND